jgi:hypothetical protein
LAFDFPAALGFVLLDFERRRLRDFLAFDDPLDRERFRVFGGVAFGVSASVEFPTFGRFLDLVLASVTTIGVSFYKKKMNKLGKFKIFRIYINQLTTFPDFDLDLKVLDLLPVAVPTIPEKF